jgi:hypothetical protein
MAFGRSDEIGYDPREWSASEAGPMSKGLGLLLIVLGVVANNLVYLQDLWLGQGYMSLDGWRAYVGILVSLAIIVVGMVVLARSRAAG